MTTTVQTPAHCGRSSEDHNDELRIARELGQMKKALGAERRRSITRELFPLKATKKRPTLAELEVPLRIGARCPSITTVRYERMVEDVEAALRPLDPVPLAFSVIDNEGDHYYLLYHPASRAVALRVLQALDQLPPADRTRLLLALHNPDVLACVTKKEIACREALILHHCRTAEVGRFERVADFDDLPVRPHPRVVKLTLPYLYHCAEII